MINSTTTKSNVGKKGLLRLTYTPIPGSVLKVIKTGTLRQDLKRGPWRPCCLLVCSSWLSRFGFLHIPGQAAQGQYCQLRAGPSHSQENVYSLGHKPFSRGWISLFSNDPNLRQAVIQKSRTSGVSLRMLLRKRLALRQCQLHLAKG